MLEGCHLKLGAVVAAKIERCGTPVFAPIVVERLMMRAGQKQDAKCLWRSSRGSELVGCSGGPWVVNGEREPGSEGG